jgi:hypothetical protein
LNKHLFGGLTHGSNRTICDVQSTNDRFTLRKSVSVAIFLRQSYWLLHTKRASLKIPVSKIDKSIK